MPEPTAVVPRAPTRTAVPRPPLVNRLRAYLGLVVVASFVVVAYQQTDFDLVSLFTGATDFFRFFGRLVPDWTALPQIWRPLIETMQIAYVGTRPRAPSIALPLIFLASANTALDPVSMWRRPHRPHRPAQHPRPAVGGALRAHPGARARCPASSR